jgi:hypothetical protein
MKTKTFDCVQMKRKASLRIYEETKNLTFEERVEYWRRKSEEAAARQAARAAPLHPKAGP